MVLAVVPSAAPQSVPVFSALGIDLWPDYDRPGVLVIYRVTIAPGVPLPGQLVVGIPAAAGAPNAVAERETDGQLITLPYERTVDGETASIRVNASRPIVQLEYYDPAIDRDGATRSFAFTWPGDYEVGDFSISVQQPDLAQNFVMVPAPTSSGPSADGLMYHTLTRAGVAAGEVIEVQVSYDKVSDQLSTETMTPVSTPEATPGAEIVASSDTETVVIVLAAALVFAAAVVIGLMFRSRQPAEAPPQPAPPVRKAGRRPSSGKGRRFCTQCGAAAESVDRFCHRCGAGLNT